MKRFLAAVLFFVIAWAFAQPAPSQAPQGWEAVRPGNWAVCSNGTPWQFYVAKGDPAKVVVDFQGGGACWNAATCNPASGLYTANLQIRDLQAGQGIYNRSNPQNPFREWTHVFVPYCTADLHWGNRTARYGELTVQHKGAVNALQAILWVYSNIAAPRDIFVTGCSAGAYGSILWAPYLMRRYPGASVRQFGDAGVGVAPEAFNSLGAAAWGTAGAVPSWLVSRQGLDPAKLGATDLYRAVARAYPSATVSQYTTALDEVQIFFYGLINGQTQPTQETAVAWARGALGNLAAIKQAAPSNFFSYVAPGRQHCVIGRPEFYSTKVGEVSLVDWVGKLVSSGKPGDVAPPR